MLGTRFALVRRLSGLPLWQIVQFRVVWRFGSPHPSRGWPRSELPNITPHYAIDYSSVLIDREVRMSSRQVVTNFAIGTLDWPDQELQNSRNRP